MPKFRVWRQTMVTEYLTVEADTVEGALEDVMEDPDKFDFEFLDADSTYEAVPEKEN